VCSHRTLAPDSELDLENNARLEWKLVEGWLGQSPDLLVSL
jgi:hypothetical protein